MSEKKEKKVETKKVDTKKEEIKNETVETAKEVKNETVETAKKVKETVKNVNIKDETLKTKGFIGEMFKDPIKKVKEIAKDDSKYFKTALFILIVWTIAVFIKSSYSTIYYWGFARIFTRILEVLKDILAPVVGVIVYSVIIFVMNKENKKSLTNIISTVTTTQIPLALASVISLLTLFSREFAKITGAINGLCSVIAIVLAYFGYKALFNEKDDGKFIKTFAIIQAIYYLVYIVLTFLGIYIY